MAKDDSQPGFWFPAKSYGWGWGPPVTWQGWVVFLVYFALLFGGLAHFLGRHEPERLLVFVAVITVLFVVVIAAKGERPVKWRWGGK